MLLRNPLSNEESFYEALGGILLTYLNSGALLLQSLILNSMKQFLFSSTLLEPHHIQGNIKQSGWFQNRRKKPYKPVTPGEKIYSKNYINESILRVFEISKVAN